MKNYRGERDEERIFISPESIWGRDYLRLLQGNETLKGNFSKPVIPVGNS